MTKFLWVIGALYLLSGLALLVKAIFKGADGKWTLALVILTSGLFFLTAAIGRRRAARDQVPAPAPTDRVTSVQKSPQYERIEETR